MKRGILISSVVLYVIPTDPLWVPDADREAAAVAVYGRQVERVGDIEVTRESRVRFYDAGECFERISCPACAAVIAENPSNMSWFVEQIDRNWGKEARFLSLDTVMPCCQASTTLNDLVYDAPQGFASWSMGARDAQQWDLADWEQRELEAALGHPVRLVYSHY